MRKENFYTLVIILLLLLNIGTLGYLWMGGKKEGHPPPPRPQNGKALLVDQLQMDKEQEMQFEIFRRRHMKRMDSIRRATKETQVALFELVKKDDMDIAQRDSLLHVIEKYESAKHLVTIAHFHDVRTILKPEQKDLFNELIEDIGSNLTGNGRGPKGGPPHPLRR